ncbi:kumamolisin. Serine peptidase. MEROPS family S53 [Jatrophihabitans endophyticus]|uniref:Kumamolisin. Serine peptidase. MEROPS family S53 n=1 Tax=Jatrophihabitans endophyticus TaxID=1206085 RepID=A0A1M5G8L1_9ACTN|nr:S53 family peptidase [Jatrophihabitans endophyticus]SHG00160.1 kumamolisin. Serine peptidase. MEROPS family S53 [Jatrophihabitans endophyticus]
MTDSRIPFTGSLRQWWDDATVVGALAPATTVEATLVLRRRAEPDAAAFGGAPLRREELAERFGADPADLDAVRAAVEGAGAEVVSADAATRLVRVRGEADALGALFGTTLREVRLAGGGSARQPAGELAVAGPLADPLVAVLGLDDRPQARARYRVARADAAVTSYTPPQLAEVYGLPEGDGAGHTIAVVELGGGFGQDDLDAYFGGLGLATPSVTAVGVDGAENQAGQDPDGADGEVLLDIEVAGGIAPAAAQVVYFAPNTDDGFLDAVTQAAHATPAPTAMSISWGQSEDQWSPQARDAMDQAFADAALLGVTVTVAAGDDGSSDRQADGNPHADFPAASPHVLGCGGTTLQLDLAGRVGSEVVWNDGGQGGSTGGGVSTAFALPDWQAGVGVPAGPAGKAGRGVPDVAAVADPQTGYQVLVDGRRSTIGGTSAVAPLWAGLVCRLAQATGRPLGLLQPTLYAGVQPDAPAAGFRDITQGSNGVYRAQPGWDACTGLGVPDGPALLQVVDGAG